MVFRLHNEKTAVSNSFGGKTSPAWCGDWFTLNASVVFNSLESGFT